jgi:hypothetical protein
MFNSPILDVAIGLAFIFLLLSLLVSALCEMLSGVFRWRAAHLWTGLEHLLQSAEARNRLYNHPLVKGLSPIGAATNLADPAYKPDVSKCPSYIPSRVFALALVDVLRDLAKPNGTPRKLQDLEAQSPEVAKAIETAGPALKGLAGSLAPLFEEAAGDIERFRAGIETWFNDGMDRVSGSYKRHTMAWQAGIGLVLAVALNIDALFITRALWRDPALRQSLVAEAQSYANAPPAAGTSADEQFRAVRTQISALGLPLGWRACDARTTEAESDTTLATPLLWCATGGWSWAGLLPMILGWAVTAAAVSMGAPFWFDSLRRIISIRSAGKAPEERPTPPKEVPRPREPPRV